MPSFSLRDLTFEVPSSLVTDKLYKAFSKGRYEHQESSAILRHLRPGDRFLDLGSGIGYLCALAARVLGAEAVTGIEPTPELVEVARHNLTKNGFDKVRLIHGAVTATDMGYVELVVRRDFWANALKSNRNWPQKARMVQVSAYSISSLLEIARPTVICADIEGSEIEVLSQPLPGVRLIVVEFHPNVYGMEGIDQIGAGLEAQGFMLDLSWSRDRTVIFRRDSIKS